MMKVIKSSSFLVLLLSISWACSAWPGSCFSQNEEQDAKFCANIDFEHSSNIPSSWDRYIVRFKEYSPIANLHAALTQSLAHTRDWEIIPRANPAVQYPSDFAVIALAKESFSLISAALLLSPAVRDIHPDKTIRALLHNDDEDSLRAVSEHATFNSTGEVQVGKRSGRLNTMWSSDKIQSVEDIVAELKYDAAIIQSRRAAHSVFGSASRCNETACGTSENVLQTADRHMMSWGALSDIDLSDSVGLETEAEQRRALRGTTQVTTALGAHKLWSQGFKGAGIRIGVFDTGIREGHPHIKNLVDRSNWTHENTLSDELGHGTFVAGVIGGNGEECPGFAPEVLLYTFKVFTNDQVSFTSWFLDAFNYAIATKMRIVNLSIGGPDFLDMPFVDKVQEITSNGIIMVSAIGNDGPFYGTLNNPADQLDVIGVGGIDYTDHIAAFSSRGMSTWQLPTGFGGSKPDILAYGREVRGSKIGGGCRSLSGTSVASPVVAGAVALLASTIPENLRDQVLNPASMKQALMTRADRLSGLNIFEQGAGKINLEASQEALKSHQPHASVVPAAIDLTDCPYMWPYCLQPLYATAQPVIFNATVLNSMGVWGSMEAPTWVPSDKGGSLLDVMFEYSEDLWPWSGHLSVYFTVKDAGKDFSGPASGRISFGVTSPPRKGSSVRPFS